MATRALDLEQVYRYTLDEYHQLIESGVFDEDLRVELIDGLLMVMGKKSREHEKAVAWLMDWLFTHVARRQLQIRVASPLTLTELRSEPEPDLFVVPHDVPQPYHPGTAAFVIEVSVSSLRRDLVTKPMLYARAGVTEYWVVDLDGRRVVCHRNPGPDGYREVTEVAADGRLTARSIDLPSLDVRELLAAAGVEMRLS
jgi:Uma2 family endonuclease